MENEVKNYDVKIIEKAGTCDNELFELMIKKGDITAKSVKDFIDVVLTIDGYATCNIKTKDKDFTITYYNTIEYGIISTGSEIFKNCVKDYMKLCNKLRVKEVKTKQGTTYKAEPVLNTQNNKQETNDELPF